MMWILIFLLILIGIPVFVALYFIGLYNKLVRQRQLVKEAWSGVEVQLKRRADLIPNLVEIVKGYAKHEKEIFEKLANARAMSIKAENIQERAKAEGELTKTLKSLFAVVENYPDLKANQNFLELQRELAEVEDQIQLSRRYYNATVRDYNSLIESFPANLLAMRFGFTPEEYFDLDVEGFMEGRTAEEQRRTPDIKF